jgi:hypothetical protein
MSIMREKPPIGRSGVEGGVGEKNAHMASRNNGLASPPAVALFVLPPTSNNPFLPVSYTTKYTKKTYIHTHSSPILT